MKQLLLLLFLLTNPSLFAQNWTQQYAPNDGGFTIKETMDGGFAVLTYNGLTKLDVHGLVLWSTPLTPPNGGGFTKLTDFTIQSDGTYAVCGYEPYNGLNTSSSTYLYTVDQSGQILTSNTLQPDTFGLYQPYSWYDSQYQLQVLERGKYPILKSIEQMDDGGLLTFGSWEHEREFTPMTGSPWYNRGLGSIVSQHYFQGGGTNMSAYTAPPFYVNTSATTTGLSGCENQIPVAMVKGVNGNHFYLSAKEEWACAGTEEFILSKTDGYNNTIILPTAINTISSNVVSDLKPTNDGGIIIVQMSNVGFTLNKLSGSLTVEWQKHVTVNHSNIRNVMIESVPSGYIVATNDDTKLSISNIDPLGNLISNTTHDLGGVVTVEGLIFHSDGSIVISGLNGGGIINPNTPGFILKINQLFNKIQGNAFIDLNNSCDRQAGEGDKEHLIVTATNALTNLNYYGTTDSTGYYQIFVPDTGSYDITIQNNLLHTYYSLDCPISTVAFVDTFTTTDTVDLPIAENAICPLMTVNISTPFLRRCFDNNYHVHYENYGNDTAHNVQIWIEKDPLLILNSTSIPITQQTGDSLLFTIGTVPPYTAGIFSFNVTVDCNNAILGQSHCIRASISPDSICFPPSNWDGANIIVQSQCDADSVRFSIQNTGAAMTSAEQYIVIADTTIIASNSYQLGSGGILYLSYPANGATYRVEADQTPNYPWSATASSSIEGCSNTGGFTMGFQTAYPEDDGAPYIDLDCQINRGAYDPNDKQGYPLGIGPENNIEPNQIIDYKIRFQNTGTDTAFRVMVLDTLPATVIPSSLVMGASSHAYTWELRDQNILKVVFDNIMLPDSNVNEPASNGFFKFKINQIPNLADGTTIDNSAAIYFDFNAPIITNTYTHTIQRDIVSVAIHRISTDQLLDIKLFPNPTTGLLNIEKEFSEDATLTVFDNLGQSIIQKTIRTNSTSVDLKDLPAGLYIMHINTGKQAGSYKIIKQ